MSCASMMQYTYLPRLAAGMGSTTETWLAWTTLSARRTGNFVAFVAARLSSVTLRPAVEELLARRPVFAAVAPVRNLVEPLLAELAPARRALFGGFRITQAPAGLPDS